MTANKAFPIITLLSLMTIGCADHKKPSTPNKPQPFPHTAIVHVVQPAPPSTNNAIAEQKVQELRTIIAHIQDLLKQDITNPNIKGDLDSSLNKLSELLKEGL